MSVEENKEFVRKLFDAIGSGDGHFLKDAFADDVKFWIAGSLPILSGTHGKDFLVTLGKSNPKSFPNGFKLTPTSMTAEGDRVAVEAETLGAHSSGKTYNNHFHFLLVIRDGKIHEWKEYMDTMHVNDVLLSEEGIKNFD